MDTIRKYALADSGRKIPHHWEIKPASAVCLADALLTEIHPHPQLSLVVLAAISEGQFQWHEHTVRERLERRSCSFVLVLSEVLMNHNIKQIDHHLLKLSLSSSESGTVAATAETFLLSVTATKGHT